MHVSLLLLLVALPSFLCARTAPTDISNSTAQGFWGVWKSLPKVNFLDGAKPDPPLISIIGSLVQGKSPEVMTLVGYGSGYAVYLVIALICFLVYLIWAPCYCCCQCCKCCCCSYRMPCCCCRCCVWKNDQPINCCKYCSRVFYIIFLILTTLCIACAYMGNSQFPVTITGAQNGINGAVSFAHEVLGAGTDLKDIGTSVCTTVEHAVDLISTTLGSRDLLYEKLNCVSDGLDSTPDFDMVLKQLDNVELLKSQIPTSASLSSEIEILNKSLSMLDELPALVTTVGNLETAFTLLPKSSDLSLLTNLTDFIGSMPSVSDVVDRLDAFYALKNALPDMGALSALLAGLPSNVSASKAKADELSNIVGMINSNITLLTSISGSLGTNLNAMDNAFADMSTSAKDYHSLWGTPYAATTAAQVTQMIGDLNTIKDRKPAATNSSLATQLAQLDTVKENLVPLLVAFSASLASFNDSLQALPIAPLRASLVDVDSTATSLTGMLNTTIGTVANLSNAIDALPSFQTLLDLLTNMDTAVHLLPDIGGVMDKMDVVQSVQALNFSTFFSAFDNLTNLLTLLPNATLISAVFDNVTKMLGALNCTTYFINVVRRLNETVVGLPDSFASVLDQAESAMDMNLPDLDDIKTQIKKATDILDQLPDFSVYQRQLDNYTDQLQSMPNVTTYMDSLTSVNSSIKSLPNITELVERVSSLNGTLGSLPDFGGMVGKLTDLRTILMDRPNITDLVSKLDALTNAMQFPSTTTQLNSTLSDVKANLEALPNMTEFSNNVTNAQQAANAIDSSKIDTATGILDSDKTSGSRSFTDQDLIAMDVAVYGLAQALDKRPSVSSVTGPLSDAQSNIGSMPSTSDLGNTCTDVTSRIDGLPDTSGYVSNIDSMATKATSIETIDSSKLTSLGDVTSDIRNMNLGAMTSNADSIASTLETMPSLSDLKAKCEEAVDKVSNPPKLSQITDALKQLDDAPSKIPDLSSYVSQIQSARTTIDSNIGSIRSQMKSMRSQVDSMFNMLDNTVGQVSSTIDSTISQITGQIASIGAMVDGYNASFQGYITKYYPAEYETIRIWALAGILALPLIGLAIGLCAAFLCRKGCCVCCGSMCLLWTSILIWLLAFVFQILGTVLGEGCDVINDKATVEFALQNFGSMLDSFNFNQTFGGKGGLPMANAAPAPQFAGIDWSQAPPGLEHFVTHVEALTGMSVDALVETFNERFNEALAAHLPRLLAAANIGLGDITLPEIHVYLNATEVILYYFGCVGTDPLAAIFDQKSIIIDWVRGFLDVSKLLPAGYTAKSSLLSVVDELNVPIGIVSELIDSIHAWIGCPRVNSLVFSFVDVICVTFLNSILLLYFGLWVGGCCICPTVCCLFAGRSLWPKWDPNDAHNWPKGYKPKCQSQGAKEVLLPGPATAAAVTVTAGAAKEVEMLPYAPATVTVSAPLAAESVQGQVIMPGAITQPYPFAPVSASSGYAPPQQGYPPLPPTNYVDQQYTMPPNVVGGSYQ